MKPSTRLLDLMTSKRVDNGVGSSPHLLDALASKRSVNREGPSGIWSRELSHPKRELYLETNAWDFASTYQFVGVGGWSVDEDIYALVGCNNVKRNSERSGLVRDLNQGPLAP